MGKRVLFSPVGGTDPIKYQRDGSLLHICRIYQPDEVYLYLSHEMIVRSNKDNRYCRSLELLGEKLKHTFHMHLIERNDLIDAQKYDYFYADFREQIIRIQEKMCSEDELILNMASGTPAMKSALMIIATLAEYRFRAIQVSSPKRASNEEFEERENYDVELNWEYDLDNKEEYFENRCEEVQCLHLMRLLKIETIKKHLFAYDYPAALTVAKEIEDELSNEAMRLLRIADERVKLNQGYISVNLPKGDPYHLFPVREENRKRIFEYALVLQMKVTKQEYADFIRGITPIVVDLLENILKNHCHVNIDKYCFIDKHDNVRKWSRKKLYDTEILDILNARFTPSFKYGPVYSAALDAIIQAKCTNEDLKNKVSEILEVEKNVRNLAAHEIISVTDSWFRKTTGKSANEIMDIIKYLIVQAGIQTKKEDWTSYDIMNRKIVELLEKC